MSASSTYNEREKEEKKTTQTKFTISTNHSTLMKKHIHLNNLLYLFRSLEFYKTKRNDECASVSIKRKQLYETRNSNNNNKTRINYMNKWKSLALRFIANVQQRIELKEIHTNVYTYNDTAYISHWKTLFNLDHPLEIH